MHPPSHSAAALVSNWMWVPFLSTELRVWVCLAALNASGIHNGVLKTQESLTSFKLTPPAHLCMASSSQSRPVATNAHTGVEFIAVRTEPFITGTMSETWPEAWNSSASTLWPFQCRWKQVKNSILCIFKGFADEPGRAEIALVV